MRLIDAEAFKNRLKKIVDRNRKQGNALISNVVLSIMCDEIDQEPTVNIEKTGHWIIHPTGEFGTCDVCFKQEDFPEYKADFGRFNKVFAYCPNCGAKMVQEGEE